ncbi:MAG: cyclase family protein [Flavobacteriaceae bacterium]|nr:cyclase family protein [Flavobacteriaceae bacterium]
MKKLFFVLLFVPLTKLYSQNISDEKKDYDIIFKKISNSGKWGVNDKKGTVNYIDNDKILSSLKIPEKGKSVSLSFDISLDSTQVNYSKYDELTQYDHQASPVEHNGYDWATDEYKISYHGFTVSHMDGLAHLGENGKLYNDFDASKITSQGFEEIGVENYKEGIITKGVLIDIPLLYRKDFLKAGTKITIQDIERFEKKYNVKIEKGDVVLVRTGRWKEKIKNGDWDTSKLSTGLNYRVAILLSERKVSVLGSDGTNDLQPSPIPEEGSPIHKLTLVSMGMPLLDNLNLENIAEEAIKQNKWEFLIAIQPIRFKGGTGSPVNAVAIF